MWLISVAPLITSPLGGQAADELENNESWHEKEKKVKSISTYFKQVKKSLSNKKVLFCFLKNESTLLE